MYLSQPEWNLLAAGGTLLFRDVQARPNQLCPLTHVQAANEAICGLLKTMMFKDLQLHPIQAQAGYRLALLRLAAFAGGLGVT